jgi:penicillin-binding protein 1C
MGAEVTGLVAGHRLLLDNRDLGEADARPQILAGPGAHRLALADPSGRIVDQVRFVVR